MERTRSFINWTRKGSITLTRSLLSSHTLTITILLGIYPVICIYVTTIFICIFFFIFYAIISTTKQQQLQMDDQLLVPTFMHQTNFHMISFIFYPLLSLYFFLFFLYLKLFFFFFFKQPHFFLHLVHIIS